MWKYLIVGVALYCIEPESTLLDYFFLMLALLFGSAISDDGYRGRRHGET